MRDIYYKKRYYLGKKIMTTDYKQNHYFTTSLADSVLVNLISRCHLARRSGCIDSNAAAMSAIIIERINAEVVAAATMNARLGHDFLSGARAD